MVAVIKNLFIPKIVAGMEVWIGKEYWEKAPTNKKWN